MKFSKNKFKNDVQYTCTCKGRIKGQEIPIREPIKKQGKCNDYKITIRKTCLVISGLEFLLSDLLTNTC